MTRDVILAEVKRTAEANGGIPLGELSFFAETRLTRNRLRRAGFPNYGDAVVQAGYNRNRFSSEALSDDQILEPLARLARALGHFPTQGERVVERYKNDAFPSESVYARLTKTGPLREALVRWCSERSEYKDVNELLRATLPATRSAAIARSNRKVVTGYVYLMRYGSNGKDFKIGHTENLSRREAQVDMMSPSDVRIVHSIETDDPIGIEKYWQERFAAMRIKTKEVFRLSAEDVAAFRRRQYQ